MLSGMDQTSLLNNEICVLLSSFWEQLLQDEPACENIMTRKNLPNSGCTEHKQGCATRRQYSKVETRSLFQSLASNLLSLCTTPYLQRLKKFKKVEKILPGPDICQVIKQFINVCSVISKNRISSLTSMFVMQIQTNTVERYGLPVFYIGLCNF